MTSKIDGTEYTLYTLDSDPELEKKKYGKYSVKEILQAVEALHEQN